MIVPVSGEATCTASHMVRSDLRHTRGAIDLRFRSSNGQEHVQNRRIKALQVRVRPFPRAPIDSSFIVTRTRTGLNTLEGP